MLGSDTLIVKRGTIYEAHITGGLGMGLALGAIEGYGAAIKQTLATWAAKGLTPDAANLTLDQIEDIRAGGQSPIARQFAHDCLYLWDADTERLFDRKQVDVTDTVSEMAAFQPKAKRDAARFPCIVRLHSAGHYPERYMQVTQTEADDLKARADEYAGDMGNYPELSYLFDLDEDGNERKDHEDREIAHKLVELAPDAIPSYCEYE